MADYHYTTQGTCSSCIDVSVEDGRVKSVSFTGGCNGNLQGISSLVSGMEVDEVIRRLKGIRCGYKRTSCPDQLCCALEEMRDKSLL
ncbi:MAG: TIGR03905 family TSCPD domain-containing protein [Clostridium sp.]|nr:TIGR03905 family TSCPD domain-containing protein [Clostridium sp.]